MMTSSISTSVDLILWKYSWGRMSVHVHRRKCTCMYECLRLDYVICKKKKTVTRAYESLSTPFSLSNKFYNPLYLLTKGVTI